MNSPFKDDYFEFKKGCPKSYSGEHSFEPYRKDKVRCVLCGKVKKTKKAK